MIEQLYPNFKFWSNVGTIWLMSDPHFGDEDLRAGMPWRPDDQTLINNINSCVGKNDTLICLGDVGDISYIPKLKGRIKILITGNHDSGASNYKREFWGDFKNTDINMDILQDNHLFDYVYTGPLMISPKIMLSHEPCYSPYWFNFHGHEHQPRYGIDFNTKNVCLDVTNYFPINLNQFIKQGGLSKIENIHEYNKRQDQAFKAWMKEYGNETYF